MQIIKKWCWVLLGLLVLFGCSNEDNNTSSGTDTVLTGVFEDAAVSGLNYSTPSRSGITNSQGEFQYIAGETVTFSIGDIVLGRARGAETVTPFDLVDTSSLSSTANPVSVDINHPQVINTLRLLQTLDSDNNPGNGINIDLNARNAANGLQLDLTQPVENFESDPLLLQYLNDAVGKLQLVDTSSAQQHFERTLGKIGGSALYSIGGTVFGLKGNLSLHNNNLDVVSVNSDGEFSFPGLMESGTSYTVDIADQPSGQTCTIQNSVGTVTSADITSIVISCVVNSQNDPTQILDGTVSGLLGTLILRTNDNINLYINNSTTSFEFLLPVTDTDSYPVVIDTPPAGQTCSIVDRTNITRGESRNVQIRCAAIVPTHIIGGTISGLAGQIELVNNNVDVLTRTENGSFVFDNPVLDGGSYNVAVRTSPTGKTCRIVNGQGSNVTSDITNIEVTCADSPTTISANINNMAGSIDMELDAGGQQPENQTASQSSVNFATPILHNQQFTLFITRQSDSRICTFRENGQESVVRTLDAFNNVPIEIDCALAHKINVNVSGVLTGELILINNGTDSLSITSLGVHSFSRPVKDGEHYLISFDQQPGNETCSLQSQNDQPVTSEITLEVTCAENVLPTFQVTGAIKGLKEPISLQLVNQDNSQSFNQQFSNPSQLDPLSYEFSTGLVHGTHYLVTILVQPVGQTCSIDNVDTNPFPRIIDENDSASRVVDITCIDDPLHVTVNVTGLSDADGTLLAVTLNGNSTPLEFTPTSAISQTFSNTVLSHNDTYTVSITNQPDEVGQTCSIESVDTNRFPRRIDAADPASQVVRIICADDPFNVSVDVSGLSAATGTLLVVMLDGDNTPLEFTPGSSNTQTFSGTVLHHGDPYTVSITDQPGEVGQTCTIGNTDTDPFPRTIDAANGGSRVVNISCVSDPFTVSINVSGLSNDPVTLLQVSIDSDPVPLTFDDTSPGSQSFTTGLIYDTPYTVAIIDQPNEVNQYCEIVQADASAPTIYSDIINTNDVVLNIQCGPRPSINNLVYNECAAPLPNQDIDTRCGNWDVDGDGIVDNEDSDPTNDTGLLACIKAGAAANQWQYVDEVTVIDCNTSLIEHPDKLGNIPPTMVGRWLVDDPRIDFLNQFENLQVLDLGKNPLRQVAVTLFDLKNSSSSNFLPNIRYINTLDNDRFPTINITFNMEGLHVANVPFAADLRSFIAIDGVTYSNNGTPANSNDDFIVESFNVNADEEVFFDCPRSLTNPNECNCPDTDGDHFCDTFEFTVQGEMWGYDLQFFSMELGGQRCQSNPSSLPNVNEINGPNYSATVTCESAFPEVNNVPDPNLKKCLIDETVTSHTLEATNITSLFCDDQNVQSLAGIENFTSLNTLSVEHPRFDDLEPIRSLPNLTYLSIFYSDPESFIRVDDLINQGVFPDQGLQNCLSLIGSSYAENVRNLDCSGFNISDLTGIERLYGLETINLSNNNIQDISPLGLLTVHPLLIQSPLRKLNLANNNIADITPLNDLLYLENVNLSGNTGIADSSVLSTFTASQRQMGWIDGVNLNGEAQRNFTLQVTTGGQIQLNATPISTFYEPFLNIRVFDLTDTEMVPNAGVFTLAEGIYKITVVEDLCGCLGSVALDVAGVGATPGEAHFVSNIVALDLARSSLGDITPISELASVGYLDLSDNPGIVSDVALLSQLPAMAFLDLTNNVNMVNGGSLVLPGVNGGQDAFDRPNVFTSSETPSAFLIVGNNTYSITDTTEVVLDPNNVNNDLLSGVPDLVTGKTVSASFNVDLHLATPNPTDYVVTLTSPNGTTITLCNQNCTGFEINGNFPNDFPANFGPIIGEPLEGTWTLFIDDQIVEAGDPGDSLESWSISN